MAVVVNSIADVVVQETENTIVNLLSNFDDPRTTGLVARFELFNSSLGGGVSNVLLFDQSGEGAPLTVQNFRNYVSDGDYINSIIHRSVPGFVIQGGGFTVNQLSTVLAQTPNSGTNAIGVIPTDPPVPNEFSAQRSNLRGTIAMAKLGTDPNSATSQWFFNLADNSANLNNQNGGFTVFGQVLSAADLAPIDAIAALPRYNAANFFGQSAFNNLPLIVENPASPVVTGDENLVRYRNITISQVNELQFTVVTNSNPDLVQATIDNNRLVLNYRPATNRTAEITIRATNLLGESVEDTFAVTVTDSNPVLTPVPTPVPAPSPTPSATPLPLPGDPTFTGMTGDDRLEASTGNDLVLGMAGNDTLLGLVGNDILNGGEGSDTQTGGEGADRFLYQGNNQQSSFRSSVLRSFDRLLDFNVPQGDRLQLDYDSNLATADKPKRLFNAGRRKGSLLQAAKTAYQDKNQRQRGNQGLQANEAVLFTWKNRTFLSVNDSQAKFVAQRDLLIEVTGMTLGAGDAQRSILAVSNYFI